MHIGLIGGIRPAATEFYYRALVRLYAASGERLRLTIANADVREMAANLEAGAAMAQASIFAGYIDQLKAGGCEAAAVTSMGGHFCIGELEAISSLPVISALPALERHFAKLGASRVGVLGTRAVMDSGLYGLASVEVIAAADRESVHSQYVAIALAGQATNAQRDFFEAQALRLLREERVEAIVLGGTDLFLAFDRPPYPYPIVDCALVHAEAIARVGMGA